jgi:hypothetical protein
MLIIHYFIIINWIISKEKNTNGKVDAVKHNGNTEKEQTLWKGKFPLKEDKKVQISRKNKTKSAKNNRKNNQHECYSF